MTWMCVNAGSMTPGNMFEVPLHTFRGLKSIMPLFNPIANLLHQEASNGFQKNGFDILKINYGEVK